ncbi:MAG: nickel-dependent hydrogenase large subunit, partial [Paracoccaceae bacterium]|nr:nickel-dependent hydrogenase large subunit [Paracoccaceae bacterium]
PAGVTRTPTAAEKVRIKATFRAFRRFLESHLFGAPIEEFLACRVASDLDAWTTGDAGLFFQAGRSLGLVEMGQGPGRFLSFGAYPLADGRATASGVWRDGVVAPVDPNEIVEHVAHSWMQGDGAHPFDGTTQPDEEMAEPGYSWCKAPRLSGETVEVGAFARQVVDAQPLALALADEGGVRARIAGRLIEVARTQLWLEDWVDALDPDARFMGEFEVPESGRGVGLVEAARGSLGHWVVIDGGRIANYQIVAPTTWNFSPRNDAGQPGALEAALVGAPVGKDETTPLSVQHIVRSFDPCMVCTVH